MATSSTDTARTTFARLRAHMAPGLALSAKFAGAGEVEQAAAGAIVELSDGRRVLDFGSYAVALLGHANPRVVAAVGAQLTRMPISTRSLGNPLMAAAAERVADYLGEERRKVYFGLSGADAIEAAVKLARLAAGRSTVVALHGAYHGKSMGALALTEHPRFRVGLEGLLCGAIHLAVDDEEGMRRIAAGGDLAAVVYEPIQGENGVVPLPVAALARLEAIAHENGALVVSDEIQVGLRRAGPRSVALAAGLDPDAVLLGKPLGGGVQPVSAVVCRDEMYAPLVADPFRHTSTFGGQPLGMAAVPAALDEIERHAPNGTELAAAMSTGLDRLRAAHPDVVAEVRGQGLIWGVVLRTPELAGETAIAVAERGLLVSPCLSTPEVLRLLPPIVARPAQVETALSILDDALAHARVSIGAAS